MFHITRIPPIEAEDLRKNWQMLGARAKTGTQSIEKRIPIRKTDTGQGARRIHHTP